MKWILIAVIFGVCVFIGFMFSLKYKRRANFFKSLVLLAQKLDVGINFSRERLRSLFDGLDENLKKDLIGIGGNYTTYLDGNGELSQAELFKGINILKEQEKEVVFMFFKMLGRTDVDSQSKEIKNFENRFQDMATSAIIDNKKYGGLSVKMGLIMGLLSAVVLW